MKTLKAFWFIFVWGCYGYCAYTLGKTEAWSKAWNSGFESGKIHAKLHKFDW